MIGMLQKSVRSLADLTIPLSYGNVGDPSDGVAFEGMLYFSPAA